MGWGRGKGTTGGRGNIKGEGEEGGNTTAVGWALTRGGVGGVKPGS